MTQESIDARIQKLEGEIQGKFPEKIRTVAQLAPEMFCGYTEMRERVLKDGGLPRKSKLLVAVGILTALRARETLKLYCRMSVNAGASREELVEAMSVGVVFSGGPGIVAMSDAIQGLDP
jgi:alkylhydroperoxidase/carboxymuconolactone decarboxylase family protein YurZ